MSTLVVIEYDDMYKAEETRLLLRRLEKDLLIDLEDAVVAIRDRQGTVKLHQSVNLTATGAVRGAYWGAYLGSLIGLIFLSPLLGFVVGAGAGTGAGAVQGALSDIGIDDDFMKELAHGLTPGSSALFVLIRKSTPDPDKVLEKLKGTGGKILTTSLKHEDAAKLQAAISAPQT
jgi:uncharacterized membrane protein